MVKLTLLTHISANTYTVDSDSNQQWIDSGDYLSKGKKLRLVCVEKIGDHQFLTAAKGCELYDSNGLLCNRVAISASDYSYYCVDVKQINARAYVYIENPDFNSETSIKLTFDKIGSLSIGRERTNDIVYKNSMVSSKHAVIEKTAKGLYIKDCSSTNGTFVNGKRVEAQKLKSGDTIFIMGLRIFVGTGYISMNRSSELLWVDESKFKTDKSVAANELVYNAPVTDNTQITFSRAPRIKKEIEHKVFEVDAPPAQNALEKKPMILTLGPSITMGLMSVAMLATGVLLGNIFSLVAAVAMLCGTILWPNIIRSYDRKKNDEKELSRQEKYRVYIENVKSEALKAKIQQKSILAENRATAADCLSRISSIKNNLWERTHNHSDFLELRIGNGQIPFNGEFVGAKRKFALESDNLQELQYSLVESKLTIDDAPITINLVNKAITGVIGDKSDVSAFAMSLLMQAVALHGYDEVKTVFIINESDWDKWSFVKWLPHAWDNSKTIRFVATNRDEVKEISFFLEKEFNSRKNGNSYNEKQVIPHYLVFAFDKELAETSDFLKNINKSKNSCGFSVLHIYDAFINLPMECTCVIDVDRNHTKILNTTDNSTVICVPELLYNVNAEKYAIRLANIKLDTDKRANRLPNILEFTEMFDGALNFESRWRENNPVYSLSAPIGVDSSGALVSLDIHEEYHGPHGVIAGTTGSGKSGLIMSYVLSMAVNYHPNEVSFVLIDYKGGETARAFARLPHTVGVITNLDGKSVSRSLASIESEITRRQRLFASTCENLGLSSIEVDIYKYQKLYRDGAVSEPLPHLIIIADEFAELKNQQQEFMSKLISISRIGRSLGVHLILATQSPSGVVDNQILSNTKFRICLRVQNEMESTDTIKRPDAASLIEAGRFYMQVGNNELFVLGQSAWPKALHDPSGASSSKTNGVTFISRTGSIVKKYNLKRQASSVSQLDAIISQIVDYAQKQNIRKRELWLPEMSETTTVDELYAKYGLDGQLSAGFAPCIGEYDIPNKQMQCPLMLKFAEKGNAIIYGSSGNGKTRLVNSLVYGALKYNKPDDVNLYLVDFETQSLNMFKKAPHIGDVIMPEESEKIENLFKLLDSEITRRRTILRDYGGNYEYYKKKTGNSMPNILVIIHNYAELAENYNFVEDELTHLTREGVKFGVFFLITAGSATSVRYKVRENFGQVLSLEMNDNTDYASIFGQTNGMVPSSGEGRGIVCLDSLYEFQTACISSTDDNDRIYALCDELKNTYGRKTAPSVPILPHAVTPQYLIDNCNIVSDGYLPIAVDKNTLSVINYPVFNDLLTWVVGERKTNNAFIQGVAGVVPKIANANISVLDMHGDSDLRYNSKINYSDRTKVSVFAKRIFEEALKRFKILSLDSSAEFEEELFIINSVTDLISALSEEDHRNFVDAIGHLSPKFKMNIVICDSIQGFNTYSSTEWSMAQNSLNNIIWLIDDIYSQYRIQINQAPMDIRQPLAEGFGVVVMDKTAYIAKMVSDYNSEDE